ncbi:hypothetical protein J6590_097628 [Homalodisca vitripennis]|nr:hypothetical protein J6590_097628 [Homalodisca vitripennis]
MENVRKRGATIHSREREVIIRVIEICKVLTVPLAKATERAANYCKVSKQSIKSIRKEAKSTPAEKLMSPGKKRRRCDQYKIKIDEFDRRVIVNVIRDFYAVKTVVPTCKKLLLVLREKIHCVWSEWALRSELKNMGFRWKKCGSKRKLLIERFEYLRNIKKCRDDKKKIFYLDETWIDSNLTFQRCWQSLEVDGVLPDMNAANRVIVLDIGSQDGFLNDEWCDHVQHIEQEYWEKDGITEDAIDEFVIRLGEDDDDSSSSDSSDDPSDPESDEKLAVPLPMDSDTSTENKMFSK